MWVNHLQTQLDNIFVNPPPLPLSCEISGALHLAQSGLTVGWLAGWLAGRLTKYRWILKLAVGRNIQVFASLMKIQHHYSLTNAFQWVFSDKAYCKVDFKARNFRKPYDF